MPLYVPERFAAREAHRAQVKASVDMAIGQLDYWNRELKRIDPRLQLVRAHEKTTLPGLKPGYFHAIRDNGADPPSIHIHEGPNGEYRDPDSGLLEDLAKGDMWNTRSRREAEKRASEAKAAAQRQRERERELRVDEIHERLVSKNRLQVLVR